MTGRASGLHRRLVLRGLRMESGTASDVGICGALGVQTGSEGNDGAGSGAAEALGAAALPRTFSWTLVHTQRIIQLEANKKQDSVFELRSNKPDWG